MLEAIIHVYCDGEGCCESIDGYNPDAPNIYAEIPGRVREKGWTVVEEADVVDGFFCGMPLTIDSGEDKHFCPNCTPKAKEQA